MIQPAVQAAAAADWTELADRLRVCAACPELVGSRHQVVVGHAPAGAELLLLTEAPSRQEDTTGRPVVGRSGHHLNFVLAEAGLLRSSVAALNVLKCRAPGGRAAGRAEVDSCRPWTMRQIELIDPLLIVGLGPTVAEWALGRGTELRAVRGHLHQFGTRPLLPTFHPSAAIRVGRTGGPAMLLEEDLRYAAALLPRLRALRAGVPC
jgi:uracil-DNA glycosylase